jgi:hypothetical protein
MKPRSAGAMSIATPRLQDARTPREERLSRTPGDAMRAALARQSHTKSSAHHSPRPTPSSAHEHSTASTAHAPTAMSPVPFRMPPEATAETQDQRIAAASLHIQLREPPSATKRQWKVRLGDENAGVSASNASPSPSSATSKKTSSAREPAHRTPHNKQKKMRTAPTKRAAAPPQASP